MLYEVYANVAEPLFSNPFKPFLKPNIKPL